MAKTLAEAEQSLEPVRRRLLLGQNARELADRALSPIEPPRYGIAYASAAELYRQAMYWLAVARDDPGPRFDATLSELLTTLETRSLLHNPPALPAQSLACRSFEDFGLLAPEDARGVALALQSVSSSLQVHSDGPFRRWRIWRRRVARLGLVAAALALIPLAVVYVQDRYALDHDLSRGKAWKASSRIRAGCTPPARVCAGSDDFFFHTRREAEPWFEIDLGSPQRFSSLYIVNRRDCCTVRAIPLFVEAWIDGQWRQLARRNDKFDTWRPTFAPVTASKVRLRVGRWSTLHLADVRVLP